MIVCQCEVVSDRDVVAAAEAGARTLSAVCRATGAGTGCGTCVFSLKRVLGQHQAAPVPSAAEVGVAAS